MAAEFYRKLLELLEAGTTVWSATLLDGAPPEGAGPGHGWLWDGSAVHGSLGSAADGALRGLLPQVTPRAPAVTLEADLGAGPCRLLLELHEPDPRLLVLGAGHVAQALCRVAEPLGLRLEVLDDLAERLVPESFPPGTKLVAGPFARAADLLGAGPRDCAVILTRGHVGDYEALASLAPRGLRYLGCIGSRRKIAAIMERARAAGVPAEALERVFAPVGLDIGAETPAELAVSIAAELVATLRGADPARAGSCSRRGR